MNRKIGVIIQARMGSTRLPGKIMKDICGKIILEHVIDRIKASYLIKEIIIATTLSKKDEVVVKEAEKYRVKWFRGSEEDVLNRYYQSAKKFAVDVVVRVTSDCPLIDPQIIDEMISCFLESGDVDYLSNNMERTYPLGFDVEVFSFQALEKANKSAKQEYEREHVTPYIRNHPKLFKILQKKLDKDYSTYRLTLDTPEDFELIARIYEELYSKERMFLLNDVLSLLEKRPELAKINQHIKQRETTGVN